MIKAAEMRHCPAAPIEIHLRISKKRQIAANLCVLCGLEQASQASDVGSIPIARSITHDVSIALTRLTYLNPA